PVSFSGEPQKYSSHPDLQDLPHHSPPRATHHLSPHSSAAATIHATATTSAVTPPSLPTPHQAISTPWQPPSPLSPSTAGCLHHISTTNTTSTSSPTPSPRHPQPPVRAAAGFVDIRAFGCKRVKVVWLSRLHQMVRLVAAIPP
nr:hypothetical protein [Tanacetum cinerariifolium]